MEAVARPRQELELFRSELHKLMESPEFAGSRQLREFLSYTSEQAFSGRTHLDQMEIAEHVLGRKADFNPQDDATVRKLATLTRQKLEQHYTREGAAGPVLVTLPLRSYLPQYQVVIPAGPRRRLPLEWRWFPLPLAFVAGLALGALGVGLSRLEPSPKPGEFTIRTTKGDFVGKSLDLPEECLLLGPRLADVEQVSVRLRFTPEAEAHQAGLVIWENPDNLVRLGVRFLLRNHLEFGHEMHAVYQCPPGNFSYHPQGQTGEPIWLSIRRQGRRFNAFVSADGERWRAAGSALVHEEPMPNARLGIYAYNGRRQVPSIQARFDRLGVGPVIHDIPEELDVAGFGWKLESDCPAPLAVRIHERFLGFTPIGGDIPCQADWTRPSPAGNWTLTTKIDSQPRTGETAGLVVRGDKGAVRLYRGEAVSFVHVGRIHLNGEDFPGHPPITLRLRSKNGILTGLYSRDDRDFRESQLKIRLSELGGDLRFGLRVARREGATSGPVLPARFYYVIQEVEELEAFQSN